MYIPSETRYSRHINPEEPKPNLFLRQFYDG